MKLLFILCLITIVSCTNFNGQRTPASNFDNTLVIGDSHMAGPFGQYLHQSISTIPNTNVITYGHSSSAALHWVSEKRHKLSGGVYHNLSAHKTINPNELIRMANPHPTDWREPVETPAFLPLVTDMNLHKEWSDLGFKSVTPNLVIIELGANDRRAIFDNGQIVQSQYERRRDFNHELARFATSNGAKCLWIGPPHGREKTDAEQAAVYQMLEEALEDTGCELFSSNHYKAMGCDGIHFNCREELPNAKKWSSEVFEKIKKLKSFNQFDQ